MRDYFTEFVNKKTGNVSVSEVSKVSKVLKTLKTHPFDTFDTDHFGAYPAFFYKKEISEVLPSPSKSLVLEFIKRLQTSGVNFYLSPQYFETGGRQLSQAERENLQSYSGAILCQLQQAALENFIFNYFPDIREQFKFEVLERAAIIAETDEPNAEYKAVRQTAFIWFHDYFLDGVFN